MGGVSALEMKPNPSIAAEFQLGRSGELQMDEGIQTCCEDRRLANQEYCHPFAEPVGQIDLLLINITSCFQIQVFDNCQQILRSNSK